MLLVDPAIPDQDAVRERVAPKFAAFGAGAPRAEAMRLRQCAAIAAASAMNCPETRADEKASNPRPNHGKSDFPIL
jgi:hypothetical protein